MHADKKYNYKLINRNFQKYDHNKKNCFFFFRLNPYNCISMEYEVGMIEVVDEAETVANIQKQSALFNAASTISKANLFRKFLYILYLYTYLFNNIKWFLL